MNNLYQIALCLLFLPASIYLQAQSRTIGVEGIVLDSLRAGPLELAAVIALDTSGKFVSGTTTDAEGKYQLNLPIGKYQLEYSFVGYYNQRRNIDLATRMPNDFTIYMISNESTLSEVEVVGERSHVEHKIDRKVIHVGKDLQAVGDAIGLLEQLAEVQVDPEGQVQLRGSSQVKLLLNGKPSPLSNSDLLQQLQASDIMQIELITTPSAKYQADGLSGMINIITRKKTQTGFRSNLNTSVSSNDQYQANLRLAYGTPVFGVYLQGGLSDRTTSSWRDRSRQSDEQRYYENTITDFSGGVKKIDFGIDYLPSERHQLSWRMQAFDNSHEIISKANIEEHGITGLQTFPFTATNDHGHLSSEYNLNYRYSWPDAEHFVELEWHRSRNNNTLWALYEQEDLRHEQLLDFQNTIDNLAIDFSQPLKKWDASLESGLLFTFKEAKNDPSGPLFNGSEIQNTFTFDEKILAYYGLIRKEWKVWQVQVGMRYEVYRSEANLGQTFKNHFQNFFPSLHLSYSTKPEYRFTFAYNRRTSRPSLWYLNPFSNPSNRFFQRQGNPNLNPEFSHNMELGGQIQWGKFSWYPSVFLRYKRDLINRVYELQEEQTIQSFLNDGRSLAYGVEFSARIKPLSFWQLSVSGNWYREQLYETQVSSGQAKLFSGNARLKNEFQLGEKLSFDVSWQYYGSGQYRFRTIKAQQKTDIALRWKLWKDQAHIGFRLTDVFNSYNYQSTLVAADFREDYRFKGETRVAYLSFAYNFRTGANGPKRSRKKRNFREAGTME